MSNECVAERKIACIYRGHAQFKVNIMHANTNEYNNSNLFILKLMYVQFIT